MAFAVWHSYILVVLFSNCIKRRMAEAHGNRTHQGSFSPPSPVLKTGRPTSDRCTSMRTLLRGNPHFNQKLPDSHSAEQRHGQPHHALKNTAPQGGQG